MQAGEQDAGLYMFSIIKGKFGDAVKLPNHTLLYGIILAVLGAFITLGSLTRIYELREFFLCDSLSK